MMRRYDRDGVASTDETMLEHPDAPAGANGLVDVASTDNGGFVVAWTNIDSDAMQAGVFYQVFAGQGGWAIIADTATVIELDEGEALDIDIIVQNEPDDGLSYFWDFGDGFGANALDATHLYAEEDTYTVTFSAIDSDLNEVSKTFTVVVSNVAPEVDAGADQTGEQGEVFYFTAHRHGCRQRRPDLHLGLRQWRNGPGTRSQLRLHQPRRADRHRHR